MYSKLKLKNFLSWEELDFDFPSGVTLIEGFNHDDNSPEGCGKSAILNGMTWVIYGEIPKDVKVNQIIRENTKKAEGSLVFNSGHVVKRSRTKSGGTVELYLPDGRAYLGKDIKETQTFIDELMGMSYDTFLQSVYFAQNYAVKFITSDEKTRVKVLSDIADLTVFDKAVKEVTGMMKLEKEAKVSLENELKTAQMKAEEKHTFLHYVKQQKEAAEVEKEEKIKKATERFEKKAAECEEYTEFLDANTVPVLEEYLGATQTEIEGVDKKIEKLTKKLGSIDNLLDKQSILKNNVKAHEQSIKDNEAYIAKKEGRVTQLQMDLDSVDDKALTRANKLEVLIVRLNEKIQKLENPEDPKCPTCGSELDSLEDGHFKEEIDNLNDEKASRKDEIQQTFKQAKAEKETITARAAELVEELEALDENKIEYVSKLEETAKALNSLEIPDLSATEEALEELQERRSKLNSDLYENKTKIEEVNRITKDLEKAAVELEELDAELEAAEAVESSKFNKDIKAAEKAKKDAEANTETVQELLTKKLDSLKDLTKLRDGFKETKAYTFKALLRDLTNKSNYYLAQLFDLPINIEFTNETEAGGIAKITDVVTIGDHERPFALYSGGQSRRIQLAVDLALSDIVASRGDKPIGLLIMDEYCKDLSENSMEKVLELFESLETSVLMIEHNTIIKNIVSNTFEIELRNGVSKCL